LRAPVLSCRKRVGSGDLALAGLLVGNRAVAFAMSDRTREHLLGFWSLLDEILNSVLFLIIGLEVIAIAIGVSHLLAGLLAIPVVLGARARSASRCRSR
jgi:CPA1 family monovalent cation:H+ antiporter